MPRNLKGKYAEFKEKWQQRDPSSRKLLYGVILIAIYAAAVIFDFVFYKIYSWNSFLFVSFVIFAVILGISAFQNAPTDTNGFISGILSIGLIFGLIPWLGLASPWSPQLKKYYNNLASSVSEIQPAFAAFTRTFTKGLTCMFAPTSAECLAATQPTPTQAANLGIEIKKVVFETAIPDSPTSITISVKNEGEVVGFLYKVSAYGNASNDCKDGCVQDATVRCDGCLNQIIFVNDRVMPKETRDFTATFTTPCGRNQKTYPYNFSITYNYSVSGSLPVDVMNRNEFEQQLQAGDFRQSVSTTSTSGPVSASISFGTEGLQPLKGGSTSTVFIKLTNVGNGRFRLISANVDLPFSTSDCMMSGKGVLLPIISEAEERWYKPGDDMIIRCYAAIPYVSEKTKRYIATISAAYYYENSKYGEIPIDVSLIPVKCDCEPKGFACKENPCSAYTICSPQSPYCERGYCCAGLCGQQ